MELLSSLWKILLLLREFLSLDKKVKGRSSGILESACLCGSVGHRTGCIVFFFYSGKVFFFFDSWENRN